MQINTGVTDLSFTIPAKKSTIGPKVFQTRC